MLSREQQANYLIIRLSGELDITCISWLRRDLETALAHSTLVGVDLSRVEFLDCAAYNVFIAARNLARGRGGDLILAGARGSPRRLLRLVGYSSGIVPELERLR